MLKCRKVSFLSLCFIFRTILCPHFHMLLMLCDLFQGDFSFKFINILFRRRSYNFSISRNLSFWGEESPSVVCFLRHLPKTFMFVETSCRILKSFNKNTKDWNKMEDIYPLFELQESYLGNWSTEKQVHPGHYRVVENSLHGVC